MSGKYDPNIHHRRSIRLDGYDYSQDGWYSVTMCALGHKCLFGKFADGQIRLYEYGRIIDKCWKWLAEQYDYVHLDRCVVMPNHLHGIIIIRRGGSCKGGSRTAPYVDKDRFLGGSRTAPYVDKDRFLGGSRTAPYVDKNSFLVGSRTAPTTKNIQKCKPLSRLIGAFKTVSTKQINIIRNTPGRKLWQRNYYEHIIRNEEELKHIRQYIFDNPANWQTDKENPNVTDNRIS